MSSNKTTNYQLHAWEPGDDVRRFEFNENFEKIDAVLTGIATGTYTGDGEFSRFIEVGFTPRALLIHTLMGRVTDEVVTVGGLALPGSPLYYKTAEAAVIVEGGFEARIGYKGANNNKYYADLNRDGLVYYFIAFS